MKDLIKVLQQWEDYQKHHPGSEFEDFCRFYLASLKKKKLPIGASPKANQPPDLDSMFMMTLTRSTLAFWVYMRIALRDTHLSSIEDLMVCAALNRLGESRKTDIVNYAMMEMSTGTDILNRLIEKGFVNQRVDPDDKRSRLLTLSATGANALKKCFKKAGLARQIFLADVTEDDKKILAGILYPLQEKHSRLSVASKGKPIEEIHAEMIKNRIDPGAE